MRQWDVKVLTLGWAAVCLLAYALLAQTEILDSLERSAEDVTLRFGPKPNIDPKIVIVKIDAASLRDKRLGLAPWRPHEYAAILNRLNELGASVVALDIVCEHVYESRDLDLAAALAESNAEVVLTTHWTIDRTANGLEERWTLPAKEFRKSRQIQLACKKIHSGFINFPESYVRDAWLFRPDPIFEDRAVSSFAVAVAACRGDVLMPSVWPPDDRLNADRLGKVSELHPEIALSRIYYAGPAGTFPSVNIQEVMGFVENSKVEELIQDATVIVGATAPEYHDLFDTPMNPLSVNEEAAMPGVEIHANIVNQLAQGLAPRRCSPIVAWLWTIGSSFVLLIGLFRRRYYSALLILPLGICFLWALTQLVFSQWLVFLPIWGSIFVVSSSWIGGILIRWAKVDRQRSQLRSVFSRCLHDKVIADLLDKPESAAVAGQKRVVTVFFCDIRGFTQLVEQVSPEEVVNRLKSYFEAMCEVIYEHDGAVDKFIGDAIMAFFGTPHPDEDHAEKAVRCAIAMQEKLAKVNVAWREDGLPPLEVCFGISTGEVVAGMIGSKRKMEYTVIGDAVNLASRLESLNRDLDSKILISERTKNRLSENILTEDKGSLQIRGKAEPVKVYVVLESSTAKGFDRELRELQDCSETLTVASS